MNKQRTIYISIISHNQAILVEKLLNQLLAFNYKDNINITLIANTNNSLTNTTVRGSEKLYSKNDVQVVQNNRVLGFGENHNSTFRRYSLNNEDSIFLVLNPDIILNSSVLEVLQIKLNQCLIENVGVLAPSIVNGRGFLQDSARNIPSPIELVSKLGGRYPRWEIKDEGTIYYPDWVAGMFMMFSTEAFAAVGGFDERYHLYYEDVDICSRLWLAGYKVMVDPSVSVIHDAQRTSHRNLRYLSWHAQSAARFFLSPTYRRARAFHKLRQGSGNIEGLIDSLPP